MGIQTPSLQTAVLFVRSSPLLRNNFDSAVDSITTIVETIKDTTKRPFSQVSSATTDQDDGQQASSESQRGGRASHGGRGRGYRGRGYQGRGGRGRGHHGRSDVGEPWTEPISTRWYQGHELARMSEGQRQQMRDMRKGRESQRQIGSAQTGQYGAPPNGRYYPTPPPHHQLPPYPLPPMPPMGPPPPPLPAHNDDTLLQHPAHNFGAIYQRPPYPRDDGGRNRYGGFAPPGPPRF
jgi:hypothetical protein